jgi:hypothetical protein
MSDRALIGTFYLGTFCIDVYPLVVEGGVGKEVDTVLVDFLPFRVAEFLA